MRLNALLLSILSPALAMAQSTTTTNPPTKFAFIIYDGFQILDAYGPMDTLFFLNKYQPGIELSILAPTNSSVNSKAKKIPQSIGGDFLPTHSLDDAPDDIEVLLVPGGAGARDLEGTQVIVDFIKDRFPKLRYLLTVCTGASLAARSGVLDGKNATTNKISFDWVTKQGPKVNWIRHARWVIDDNIYSSSGVSAGIDMMYAFIVEQFGEAAAAETARNQEYIRNTDPNNDPFDKLSHSG